MNTGPGSSFEGIKAELWARKKAGWVITYANDQFQVTIPKDQNLENEAWWVAQNFAYGEFVSIERRRSPDTEYLIHSRSGAELRFTIRMTMHE
jgi:hypothetical protein